MQPVVRLPGSAGYDAGAAGADVLREASLRRRVGVQTVELHRHRQGIAVFRSARRVRHWNAFPLPNSEFIPPSNPREWISASALWPGMPGATRKNDRPNPGQASPVQPLRIGFLARDRERELRGTADWTS